MANLVEETQYDVYCWAQDDAVDSFNQPRLNYMTSDYVGNDLVSYTAPQGGRTAYVWVVDSTPPTVIHVATSLAFRQFLICCIFYFLAFWELNCRIRASEPVPREEI